MADDEGASVHSLADRAAAGEGDEPEQETFPMGIVDPEHRKTLKTLIASGQPVEMTVSMQSAEVPLRGGLPDPNRLHRFLVTTRFHKAEPIAVYDPDDETKIKSWKLRVTLKPRFVELAEEEAPAAAQG